VKSSLLIAALALSLTACSDSDDAKAPEGGDASAKVEEAPKAPAKMEFDAFAAALPKGMCKVTTGCKNEPYVAVVDMMMMMMVGFGTMDDADAQAKIAPIGKAMETEKRSLFNMSECETIAGYAFNLAGLDAEGIKASVAAGKVDFNAEQAAACAKVFDSQPEMCKTEVKIEGEFNMGEAEKIGNEMDGKLDDFLKPCEGVFVGKVAVGAECSAGYECAGDNTDCQEGKCVEKAAAPAAAQ